MKKLLQYSALENFRPLGDPGFAFLFLVRVREPQKEIFKRPALWQTQNRPAQNTGSPILGESLWSAPRG